MKNLIITKINDGYIPPIIKAEDYIFGSSPVPDVILQEDGQWLDFLPDISETQIKTIETYNCTGFGSLNQIEVLEKKLFNNK